VTASIPGASDAAGRVGRDGAKSEVQESIHWQLSLVYRREHSTAGGAVGGPILDQDDRSPGLNPGRLEESTMLDRSTARLAGTVRQAAHPLTGSVDQYDRLLDLIGDAPLVLVGEATHGTHEFYHERAEITKRLILEKGFLAVAAEADWPDAYRVNCYAKGVGNAASSDEALGGFKRFPTWMWRNEVVRDFVEWLRQYNQQLPQSAPSVGFYGLDLYSLFTSIESVIRYLDRVDPEAAKRARERYACFDQFGEEAQTYGYATALGLAPSCEEQAVQQLLELRRSAAAYANRDGRVAQDDFFYAEQNARVAADAEEYYRSMFHGRINTWNLRDQHMYGTLEALLAHFTRQGQRAKIVVWEHNTHVGDARATEMGQSGELNVGQLVRQQHGTDAVLIGFTTYLGEVSAASDWDRPVERKHVRPALPGSYETTFHETGIPRFWLPFRPPVLQEPAVLVDLRKPRLERAIGVVYVPETERMSHYFFARLPSQFDAIIHIDETSALHPLEHTTEWNRGEVPETYPSAL
jgi:erythromycin esterase-like protein